ncbi:MAG TPA: hypothetical protein VEA99_19735, partial [Gemmatimonadaceae bacterium]|nr:hypothetical protein [Gemmatimonadaceae bacterium]
MNHRHLLPNEIDLLVDGEVGFGVAPLKAHVADCVECRTRLEEAKVIVEALEGLPHFAPSVNLADRVLAQVPVFVPWHVAARDSLEQALEAWAPRSRPLRTAAYAMAASALSVLTLALLWIGTHLDVLAVAGGLAGSRLDDLLGAAARGAAGAMIGEPMLAAIQQAGLAGVGMAAGGFVVAAAGTFVGLRA